MHLYSSSTKKTREACVFEVYVHFSSVIIFQGVFTLLVVQYQYLYSTKNHEADLRIWSVFEVLFTNVPALNTHSYKNLASTLIFYLEKNLLVY